jgi:protein-tyrosine kinase
MSIIEKAMEKVGGKEWNQVLPKKSQISENERNNNEETPDLKFKTKSVLLNKHEDVPLVGNNTDLRATSGIVSINREKLSRQGFLCPEDTGSQMAEEYRIIKRPLVNNALGAKNNGIKRANLILIASSQPGEGKTFTAINLALSIASERDKKVLLVDADVAKPSICNVLGIKENRCGLIDYLDGEDLDFSMMMIKTDIPGLSFIPAGKRHGYSTELLASDRMAILAEELHVRYPDRIVIFDSPPLLAATQAEVLAGLVGQVVLVVEAENTSQNMVKESMNKLKVCDVVLALMNKSMRSFDLNYFGYGRYVQYGQYGH